MQREWIKFLDYILSCPKSFVSKEYIKKKKKEMRAREYKNELKNEMPCVGADS